MASFFLLQLNSMAPNTDITPRALIVTLKSPVCGKHLLKFQRRLTQCTANQPYLCERLSGALTLIISPLLFETNGLKMLQGVADQPRKLQIERSTAAVISKVREDRYGREKTAADIAGELSSKGIDISSSPQPRSSGSIVKKAGFRKTKPTRKPGLTEKMKLDRLQHRLDLACFENS